MRLACLSVLLATAAFAQDPPPIRVTLHGDVQADGRAVWGATDASTFLVRRARLLVEGSVDERFRVRVMPDVGNGRIELLDAFVEADVVPGVAVRAGKFKGPVGLERLRAPTGLDLPERAFPTLLVPNRDVGLMLRLTPGRQTVELALTNGVVDGGSGDIDVDAAKDVTARVMLRPVRSGVLSGLSLGVAATAGAQRGTASAPLLPTFQTAGRTTVFRYRPEGVADGSRTRLVPQMLYLAGPVSVMAEAATSRQRVRLGDASETLDQRAGQATVAVVLTGEDATTGRVRPSRPFAPESGQWGAVQVAARVHRLALDPDTFPTFANPDASIRTATAAALGVDWSLTDAVRLQLSTERTVFSAADGSPSREAETALIGRLQLIY